MYKLLLCWRYLKTRYLAFACIISVMLGVATLIVVNSVMNGFSTKLRTLLHSVIGDVAVESLSPNGFVNPEGKIAEIRNDAYLNSQIEAMAVTLDSFAMMQYRNHNGEIGTRLVRVTGIEMQSRSAVGGFHHNLVHQKTTSKPTFDLPKNLHEAFEEAERQRIKKMERDREIDSLPKFQAPVGIPDDVLKLMNDGRKGQPEPAPLPPPAAPPTIVRVPQGAVIGHLIAHMKFKDKNGKIVEEKIIHEGDQIVLTTVAGGTGKLTPVYDSFVVVDFFRSNMSEYDNNCVFVPLEHLQSLRAMDNRASSILVKVKDQSQSMNVKLALEKTMGGHGIVVNTWEEKQGPLLRAIEIEKNILNILLFMIIAVAGFGILAIFSMIVSEKTRDIGILKALGASSGGVMKIFVSYGLLLGVVGSLCGTILGLTITWNINAIENAIALITGDHLFKGDIYYFSEIPTDVNTTAVVIVNLGAVAIAVVFSIIPALRAAMLHPVQALRYE